jgi:hypothetical protein
LCRSILPIVGGRRGKWRIRGVGEGTACGLGDRGVDTSAETFIGGDNDEELARRGGICWRVRENLWCGYKRRVTNLLRSLTSVGLSILFACLHGSLGFRKFSRGNHFHRLEQTLNMKLMFPKVITNLGDFLNVAH